MPTLLRSSLLVVSVAALALTGCTRRSAARVEPPPGVQVNASTLGPGDVLEVRVYREPELSGIYQIGSEGDVVFPLCQRVVVNGLTPNGASDRFRECLSAGFIRDPQV